MCTCVNEVHVHVCVYVHILVPAHVNAKIIADRGSSSTVDIDQTYEGQFAITKTLHDYPF